MKGIVIAPIAGGLSLGVLASGACGQLVAIPVAALGAFALLSISCALALYVERGRALMLVALGFGLGISLPRQLPSSGDVVANGRALHGIPADMYGLLEQIDRAPGALLGRRVAVSGQWSPASHGNFASVSRRVMTCCAADAIRVGFDVIPEDRSAATLNAGASICVEGVLQAAMRDGELRYVIERAHVGASCRHVQKNALFRYFRAADRSRAPQIGRTESQRVKASWTCAALTLR